MLGQMELNMGGVSSIIAKRELLVFVLAWWFLVSCITEFTGFILHGIWRCGIFPKQFLI